MARGLVLTMLAFLATFYLLSYCNFLACRVALLPTLAGRHENEQMAAALTHSILAVPVSLAVNGCRQDTSLLSQKVIGAYDTMSVPGSTVATHRVACPSQTLLDAAFHWVHRFYFSWLGRRAVARSPCIVYTLTSHPWRRTGAQDGGSQRCIL